MITFFLTLDLTTRSSQIIVGRVQIIKHRLQENTMTKTVYEAPSINEVGTFEALTQGASTGSKLDATFPNGTAFGDLTFS